MKSARQYAREEIQELPNVGFMKELAELLEHRHKHEVAKERTATKAEPMTPLSQKERLGLTRIHQTYDGNRPMLSVEWRTQGRNREVIFRTRRADTHLVW